MLLPISASAQTPDCPFQQVSADAPKLHIGYFAFPPYAVQEPNGSVSGIWVDYVKLLLGRSGIEYTEAIYPAKRLATELFSGGVNLSIIANNILVSAGEKRLTFLKEPVMQLRSGIASLKETPITSLDALKNHTVGVNRGYSYGGLIYEVTAPERNITLWPTDSELQIIRLLLGQRLQAAILYESILTHGPAHWNIEAAKIHFEPLYNTGFYIALNKSTKHLESIESALSNNTAYIDLNSVSINCSEM